MLDWRHVLRCRRKYHDDLNNSVAGLQQVSGMELEVRLLQLYSRVLVDDPTNTSEHECLSPRSELRAAVLQWESPEGREQLLADAGHISTWEVSAVTNMSGLFQESWPPKKSMNCHGPLGRKPR